MTQDVTLKVGKVTLLLKWDRRAKIRFSDAGGNLRDLTDDAKSESTIWKALAAGNHAANSSQLTFEQLYLMAPDFSSDEEEVEFNEMVASALMKMLKGSEMRGKKPAPKRKSGPSRAGG